MVTNFFSFNDVSVVLGVKRVSFSLKDVEAKNYVFRRDRFTIMPARFRPEVELDPGVILRVTHGFSEEPVARRGFVE